MSNISIGLEVDLNVQSAKALDEVQRTGDLLATLMAQASSKAKRSLLAQSGVSGAITSLKSQFQTLSKEMQRALQAGNANAARKVLAEYNAVIAAARDGEAKLTAITDAAAAAERTKDAQRNRAKLSAQETLQRQQEIAARGFQARLTQNNGLGNAQVLAAIRAKNALTLTEQKRSNSSELVEERLQASKKRAIIEGFITSSIASLRNFYARRREDQRHENRVDTIEQTEASKKRLALFNQDLKAQERQAALSAKAQQAASAGVIGAATGRSAVGRTLGLGGAGALAGGAAGLFSVATTLSIGQDFVGALRLAQGQLNLTESQLKAVRDEAIRLGNDIKLPGVSAKDAADAILQLAKAGLTLDDNLKSASAVLQLGRAAEVDFAEGAFQVGVALNAFKIPAADASKVADTLVKTLALAGGTSFPDLADAIKQVGAVFSSAQESALGANGAYVEMNATLATLAKNGLRGSDAGTSLKQVFAAFTNQSKPVQASLDAVAKRAGVLSVAYDDVTHNARPLFETFKLIQKGVKGLNDEARGEQLATIFGSDAVRAANILIDANLEVKDSFDKILDAQRGVSRQGFAEIIAAARNKGLTGALDALKSQFETFQILIFEQVEMPIARALVRTAEGIDALANGEQFAALRRTLLGMGAAAATLVAFKLAGESIQFFTLAIKGLAASPLVALSVAVVGLAGAMVYLTQTSAEFSDKFTSGLEAVYKGITGGKTLPDRLKDFFLDKDRQTKLRLEDEQKKRLADAQAALKAGQKLNAEQEKALAAGAPSTNIRGDRNAANANEANQPAAVRYLLAVGKGINDGVGEIRDGIQKVKAVYTELGNAFRQGESDSTAFNGQLRVNNDNPLTFLASALGTAVGEVERQAGLIKAVFKRLFSGDLIQAAAFSASVAGALRTALAPFASIVWNTLFEAGRGLVNGIIDGFNATVDWVSANQQRARDIGSSILERISEGLAAAGSILVTVGAKLIPFLLKGLSKAGELIARFIFDEKFILAVTGTAAALAAAAVVLAGSFVAGFVRGLIMKRGDIADAMKVIVSTAITAVLLGIGAAFKSNPVFGVIAGLFVAAFTTVAVAKIFGTIGKAITSTTDNVKIFTAAVKGSNAEAQALAQSIRETNRADKAASTVRGVPSNVPGVSSLPQLGANARGAFDAASEGFNKVRDAAGKAQTSIGTFINDPRAGFTTLNQKLKDLGGQGTAAGAGLAAVGAGISAYFAAQQDGASKVVSYTTTISSLVLAYQQGGPAGLIFAGAATVVGNLLGNAAKKAKEAKERTKEWLDTLKSSDPAKTQLQKLIDAIGDPDDKLNKFATTMFDLGINLTDLSGALLGTEEQYKQFRDTFAAKFDPGINPGDLPANAEEQRNFQDRQDRQAKLLKMIDDQRKAYEGARTVADKLAAAQKLNNLVSDLEVEKRDAVKKAIEDENEARENQNRLMGEALTKQKEILKLAQGQSRTTSAVAKDLIERDKELADNAKRVAAGEITKTEGSLNETEIKGRFEDTFNQAVQAILQSPNSDEAKRGLVDDLRKGVVDKYAEQFGLSTADALAKVKGVIAVSDPAVFPVEMDVTTINSQIAQLNLDIANIGNVKRTLELEFVAKMDAETRAAVALALANHKPGDPVILDGAVVGSANGRIVTRPMISAVGEGGKPEAIIPLTNPRRALQLMGQSGLLGLAQSVGGGGHGDIYMPITVNEVAQDPRATSVLVANKVGSIVRKLS